MTEWISPTDAKPKPSEWVEVMFADGVSDTGAADWWPWDAEGDDAIVGWRRIDTDTEWLE